MKRSVPLLVAVTVLGLLACATPKRKPGMAEFHQACADATTDSVALNVAAHPDDESARTLVYLRRHYGLRTVTIYSTCGEGGQNAIGREIGRDLACIRTRETLAATQITGTQVRWLGFADFGYSKTAEETYRLWGRDKYIKTLKAHIDEVQPDVVFTNHGPTRGHGHHQATSRGLREVVAMHPGLRLYERGGRMFGGRGGNRGAGGRGRGNRGRGNNRGANNRGRGNPDQGNRGRGNQGRGNGRARNAGSGGRGTGNRAAGRGRGNAGQTGNRPRRRPAAPPDVTLPVSDIDPSTGESYARQAMRGWRMHRTQGMGAFSATATRRTSVGWRQILPKGPKPKDFDFRQLPNLFDSKEFIAHATAQGVDPVALQLELDKFGGHASVSKHVARAKKLLPTLRDLHTDWPVAPSSTDTEKDPQQAARIRAWTRARTRLGRRIEALERVIQHGRGISVRAWLDQDRQLAGSLATMHIEVHAPKPAGIRNVIGSSYLFPAATPEQLQARQTGPNTWRLQTPFRVPDNADQIWPTAITGGVHFEIDGLPISIYPEAHCTVVPISRLTWERKALLLTAGTTGVEREVTLQAEWNGKEELQSTIEITPPSGISARTEPEVLRLSPQQRMVDVKVFLKVEGPQPEGNAALAARLKPMPGGSVKRQGDSDTSATPNLMEATVNGAAKLTISSVALERPKALKIGLIRGVDDTMNRALADLDLDFVVLDPVTLKTSDLEQFTTVIIDIRAYRTRRDLVEQRDRILKYCKDGGRVVCFYHKPGEWNARDTRPLLAPYPLRVGSRRVSQEDAAVKFLLPSHRLLNQPNKISQKDFEGWVQERGLNFPQTWDEKWVPLFEMNDKGERPLQGSLLFAEYGDGLYVYCSLVLYRQLRNGHAGATRLLMNLISQ